MYQSARIGIVSISDRASTGVYEDKGLPALKEWLTGALLQPAGIRRKTDSRRTANHRTDADRTGCRMLPGAHHRWHRPRPARCHPGSHPRIADKVLPGFGEQMRAVSLKYVPTAILSRQVGVVRGQCLILNLPGQPKAIKETLDGVFAAVPYGIDLIGGPYLETREDIIKAFRPKSAIRLANAPA
jgi:molybdopterin adenylyltransferase